MGAGSIAASPRRKRARPRTSLLLALGLSTAVLVLGAAGAGWWTLRGDSAGSGPPVFVALGASDATGVGARQPSREGWAPRVAAGLGADTRFVNLGINGATIDEVLSAELPVALDARPSLVALWPGANDLRAGRTLPQFSAGLGDLLARLDQLDGVTIVLLNLPDLRELPAFSSWDRAGLDTSVREWNAAIADQAALHGALLVDLYGQALELAAHPEYVSSDGFHPSSEGYQRIAELVLNALKDTGHGPIPAPAG